MADLSQFLSSGGKRYRTADIQATTTTVGSTYNATFTPASNEFVTLIADSYGTTAGQLTVTSGGRTVIDNIQPARLEVVGGVGEAISISKAIGTGNANGNIGFSIYFYEEDA
ncbi:hypothetical protein JC525_08925 [Alteromonas sp. IB21]|uniref:hypothetical protein n=1 Tax=Alteromonas sp. IB21 TaxID=2779369 RepID=UPI0018E89031|nr:hypothetical protein [Alteromonas sp. IB21]MBJ2129058.1 hypothetical protein [Alteromonas sp. IB21]